MTRFRAIRIEKTDAGQSASYVDLDDSALMDGDVDVDVLFSGLNFKDGAAVTGARPVVRRFPMIPGVDFSGRVSASRHPAFSAGDLVVAGGCGLGEAHFGGFAQKARLPADWLSPLPAGLSPARAMALGTAGVTAAFCVMALERFGLAPERGSVVVTGAAGGVGSVAVALLAQAGWRVVAVTGRAEEADYLRSLGASDIIDRAELAAVGKPLQSQQFAAGVDAVGGATLVNILARIQFDGAVAACGNAQSMEFPGSVAPFILRGVSLLGIESVTPRIALRHAAWERLARDIAPAVLDSLTETIPFSAALARAQEIVGGRVRGRIVIDVGGDSA